MEDYRLPKSGECYRHFKGNRYQILTIAMHTETEEQLVVYEGLYGDHPVFARPLAMFCSKVDKEKFPDATQEFRFQLEEETAESDNKTLIVGFLELESWTEKLEYLERKKAYLTDEFLSAAALSMDFTESSDNLQDRYVELVKYMKLLQKYERKMF